MDGLQGGKEGFKKRKCQTQKAPDSKILIRFPRAYELKPE